MGGKLWIGSCKKHGDLHLSLADPNCSAKHGEMWLIAIGKQRHHGPCVLLALAISGTQHELGARARPLPTHRN
jgi:hypothetical protein